MAKAAGSEDKGPSETEGRKNGPSPEVFLNAVKKQAALNAERKALSEKISQARKIFKADGIELGLMDSVIKMAEWDRGEVRQHFDNLGLYARLINLPVGTQTDMFKDMTDEQFQQAEWHNAGITAARAGRARVCPDNCPEAYMLFWDAGYDGKPLRPVGAPKPAAPPKPGKTGKTGASAKSGKPAKGAIAAPPVVDQGDAKPGLKVVAGQDTEQADGIGGPGTPGHSDSAPSGDGVKLH